MRCCFLWRLIWAFTISSYLSVRIKCEYDMRDKSFNVSKIWRNLNNVAFRNSLHKSSLCIMTTDNYKRNEQNMFKLLLTSIVNVEKQPGGRWLISEIYGQSWAMFFFSPFFFNPSLGLSACYHGLCIRSHVCLNFTFPRIIDPFRAN